MKELRIYGKEGVMVAKLSVKVSGDDFFCQLPHPIHMSLTGISLTDYEEEKK